MVFDAEAVNGVTERLLCSRASFWRHHTGRCCKHRSNKSRDGGRSGHGAEQPRDSRSHPLPQSENRINF